MSDKLSILNTVSQITLGTEFSDGAWTPISAFEHVDGGLDWETREDVETLTDAILPESLMTETQLILETQSLGVRR